MPGPSEYIAICKTALEAGIPLLQKLRAMSLSKEEIDLLSAAARPGSDQGTLHVLNLDQATIPVIKAGGSSFTRPEDVAACARYEQAFRRLCERGYVRLGGDDSSGAITLFTLTAAGFDKAAKLSSE